MQAKLQHVRMSAIIVIVRSFMCCDMNYFRRWHAVLFDQYFFYSCILLLFVMGREPTLETRSI